MKKTNLDRTVSQGMGGVIVLLAATPCLHAAQPIIMSPPPPVTTPVWSQEETTNNEMDVFIPSGQTRTPGNDPYQLGPAVFHPHVNYSVTYGNSIEYSTNHTAGTIIQTVSPGMTVDIDRHWTLDYTPTLTYYSSSQFEDTLNHAASLNWATAYGDWSLGLSQNWTLSTTPTVQTAAATKDEEFTTGASASYIFNDHFSADLAVGQDFNYVSDLQDSKNWSTTDWLNYSFWKRLTVGIGGGLGYTSLSPDGSSTSANGIQTYQQFQGRIQWRATDKVSFSVSAGLENTQFHTEGEADSLNPIFSASIQYLPFKDTQLSLTASRTVSSSDYYILSQSTEVTSVGASLDQRLLENFYLDVGVAYSDSVYNESIQIASATRDDNLYSFTIALRRQIFKRGTISVNYQYQDNESNTAGYTYTTSQIGFQIGYSY